VKILIVSATYKEIEPSIIFFKIPIEKKSSCYSIRFLNNEIFFLITGIGSYSTIFELTKFLMNNKIDLVINAGIAGSYNKSLYVGQVVNVISEQIGDLGISTNNSYKTIFEEGFVSKDNFPFTDGKLINPNHHLHEHIDTLKKVNSLSLNTVSGDKETIERIKTKFNADIENMEGAAFFYVCLQQKQPFLELRAISNFVEPRNKEKWEIYTAINNLNESLRILILDYLK